MAFRFPFAGYTIEVISRPSRRLGRKRQESIVRQLKEVTRLAFQREPDEGEVETHTVSPDVSLLFLIKKKARGRFNTLGYLSTRPVEVSGKHLVYLAGTAFHPTVKGKRFYELMQCLATVLQGEQLRMEGKTSSYIGGQTQSPYVYERLGDLKLHPAFDHPPESADHLTDISELLAGKLDEESGVKSFDWSTGIRIGAYGKALYRNQRPYSFRSRRHAQLFSKLVVTRGDAIVLSGFYRHASPFYLFNPSRAIGRPGVIPHLYALIHRHYRNEYVRLQNAEYLINLMANLRNEIKPLPPSVKSILRQFGLPRSAIQQVTWRLTRYGSPRLFIHFKPGHFDLSTFRSELRAVIRKKGSLSSVWEKFVEKCRHMNISGSFEELTRSTEGFTIGHHGDTHITQINPDSISVTLDAAGAELMECVKNSLRAVRQ